MENMKLNNSGSGKVIGALLLGAAIGVAAGILFAPDKGSKTRTKLFGGAENPEDNDKENKNSREMSDKDILDQFYDSNEFAENEMDEFEITKTFVGADSLNKGKKTETKNYNVKSNLNKTPACNKESAEFDENGTKEFEITEMVIAIL